MSAIAFTPAPMPIARVGRAYIAETKYESLRMLRTPAFAIPFLGIPVAIYSFLGGVVGTSPTANPNIPAYMFTAFTVMAVMGPSLFGFGMSLALERELGVLKLKSALPMPPFAYLFAKMLMAMLFAAAAATSIAVAATMMGRVHLAPSRMAGIVALCVAGTLPFSSIGLFMGARLNARVAPAIVNVVYLAMIYLSGLFFPLPGGIRYVALVSPAFHLNQLALAMAGVGSILTQTMHLAALVGISVLFAGLTVRRLRSANA